MAPDKLLRLLGDASLRLKVRPRPSPARAKRLRLLGLSRRPPFTLVSTEFWVPLAALLSPVAGELASSRPLSPRPAAAPLPTPVRPPRRASRRLSCLPSRNARRLTERGDGLTYAAFSNRLVTVV